MGREKRNVTMGLNRLATSSFKAYSGSMLTGMMGLLLRYALSSSCTFHICDDDDVYLSFFSPN